MLITKLIHDFISITLDFNTRVDAFNRNNHLEQYAVVTPPIVETAGSDFDLDAESAVAQVERGGSDSANSSELLMEKVNEEEI